MPQPHDRFFKSLIRPPARALALLRVLLPVELAAASARHRDTALSGARRARTPDGLVELTLSAGGRVLFVLEHQARPDPRMDLRMMETALTLCRDRLKAQRGPVPPIVAGLVYSGRPAWTTPTNLRRRFADLPAQRETLPALLPTFPYALLDLRRTPPHALPAEPGLRLGLLLLGAASDREPWPLLLREASLVRLLLDRGEARHLELCLEYAAETAREPPPPGFARELAAEAGYPPGEVFMSYASQLRREGRKEGFQIGVQEGRQEGHQEGQIVGQRQLLTRLLERRFGPLSEVLLARIQAADLDQIGAWTDELLTAPDAETLLRAR